MKFDNILKYLLPVAAVVMAVATTATPVLADPIDPLPQERISLRGLDLTDPEGRALLDRRIDQAARSVCGLYSLPRKLEERQCLTSAIESARPQRDAAIARALLD